MIRVQTEDVDIGQLIAAAKEPGTGAVVVFDGVVRDDGITEMELEAYEDVATQELVKIASTATEQFRLLHPEGATALFDAIFWGSQSLEKREGRKAIVIVTDGDDTYSKTTSHQALEAAHLADAVIYPVVVVPIANDAGRNIGGEHVLTFMAEGTGGRTFLPALGPDLNKAFADIVTELRTQYLLAFYPRGSQSTKDRFHKLEVRVKGPELQVSARNGYYGEVEAGGGPADARVSVGSETTGTAPEKGKKP